MVGRYSPISATLEATNPLIEQLGANDQTIRLASDPLDHRDETANTIGPGMSFAKAYIAAGLLAPDRKILLDPVSNGATDFASGFWKAGGSGNTVAIARANTAMAAGSGANRLVAVICNFGGNDAGMSQAEYEANQDALIARSRSSITGAGPTTPFVFGEAYQQGTSYTVPIATAQRQTPSRVPYTGFANSDGLVQGGDDLHFNAAGLRTYGQRFFTALGQAQANSNPQPVGPQQGALAISDGSATEGETFTHTVSRSNALTFALIAVPVTAMAMTSKPTTAPAPSPELVELRELSGKASVAFNAGSDAEKAASDKYFKPMIAAVGEATKADNPRNQAAFSKAAATFHTNYNSACAVLLGC